MADPRYLEIVRDLEERIRRREWAPGERLPTEAELGDRYSTVQRRRENGEETEERRPASRNTVRRALHILTQRGLVEARQGQGTFVAEKPIPFITTLSRHSDTGFGGGEGRAYQDEVRGQNREPRATPPRVESREADARIASALQVEPGTDVISRHQKRYIDDSPYSLQTSFYPMSFVEKGADKLIAARDIDEGVIAYLKQTLQIEQAGYQDTITVRPPDDEETEFFSLPADGGVAVFETYRISYGSDGLPFRVTISVFPADRNIFIINVDHVPVGVVASPWIPPERL